MRSITDACVCADVLKAALSGATPALVPRDVSAAERSLTQLANDPRAYRTLRSIQASPTRAFCGAYTADKQLPLCPGRRS